MKLDELKKEVLEEYNSHLYECTHPTEEECIESIRDGLSKLIDKVALRVIEMCEKELDVDIRADHERNSGAAAIVQTSYEMSIKPALASRLKALKETISSKD